MTLWYKLRFELIDKEITIYRSQISGVYKGKKIYKV